MKVFCLSQARMGSTRLPGKILKLVQGKSLLQWHCERVQQSTTIHQHIIASTTNPNDQVLDQAIHLINNQPQQKALTLCYGDENNVLNRYLNAAQLCNAQPDDLIIRLTSDCPLVDPKLIDQLIHRHIAENINGISNIDINSYARGLDAEVFSMAALCQAAKSATTEYQREHVTPYFYQHPEQYPLLSIKLTSNKLEAFTGATSSQSTLRLCVDEINDLTFIETLISQYPESIINASATDIINFLVQNPEIVKINQHVVQKSH